jgi:Tol biopolymer transport system component
MQPGQNELVTAVTHFEMKRSRYLLGMMVLTGIFQSCLFKKDISSTEKLRKNKETQEKISLSYFGQKRPSTTPEIFAPNIISRPDRHEFGCTLSRDGHELFFGVDNEGIMEIYHTRLEKGVWRPQEKFFKNDSFNYNDPMLSPDDKKLFFITDRSLELSGNKKDIDIWFIERNNDDWSAPINLGLIINSPLNEYYTSFTDDGTMYFASRDKSKEDPNYAYDIYRAELKDGTYDIPAKLPGQINTSGYEADACIAPDESFLIFCSIRRNGFGQGDLYISFKIDEESWSPALNMGNLLNTEHHELCPFITRDGKYLFYTSNQDIYWVSTQLFDNYH